MKRSNRHQASKRSRKAKLSPSNKKRVSKSPSRLAKRVLSPSAKVSRRKPKSTSTRVSLPTKKSRRNPLRRSYLSKDLSELQLSLHKKRPQAPWISRLASPDRKKSTHTAARGRGQGILPSEGRVQKSTLLSPERLRKSIKVGHYYRSPRTECKRHGYNQAKCNNDPRCIMSSRGCQMATIGVRHVVKK